MSDTTKQPATQPKSSRGIWLRLGVVLLLCLGVLFWAQRGTEREFKPSAGVELSLPEFIGNYWGETQEISEGERVILPSDTEIAKKAYDDGRGLIINCQIVLSGADKRSIHRPEICLPGQGWNIRSGQVVPVELKSGRTLEVMKLDLVRPVQVGPNDRRDLPMVFLYWFVGENMTTPDHKERILATYKDMLLHNTMHRWAYVIVSAPVLEGFTPNGKNEAETIQILKDFIRDIVPHFQKSEMADEPKKSG